MGLQTTTLSVTGMHCASCASRVERVLQDAPGIDAAVVNLSAETATVSWSTTPPSVSALAGLVTDAGFPAEAANDNTAAETEARQASAIRNLKRHVIIAAALTLPVFLIEMGGHILPGVAGFIDTSLGRYNWWVLQFLLISAVMLWPGRQFFLTGWPALFKGRPDMNSLVALGTSAAWLYSTTAVFTAGLLPEGTRAVYFEAVGVIITLILLGRLLEARAKSRAGDAIRALLALQPDTALVSKDGAWVETPRAMLIPGSVIRLRPGEAVATDGEVLNGETWIDESMLTGEATPIAKAQGATLTGGTLNGTGTLEYRATATGQDTVLAGILRMVEDAQAAKLPIQSVVDQVIRWFVPAILCIAALTIVLWLVFGPTPSLGLAIVAAVSVLIIACPCAMGLATPTSITVGTGRAAELGVLFHRGDVLQTLQDAKLIAFDKTGTLTEGKPTLTSLHCLEGFKDDAIIAKAAAIESFSEHPLARAITQAAKTKGLSIPEAKDVQSQTGKGVTGKVDGQTVLIGNAALMSDAGLDTDPLRSAAETLGKQAETPIYVAIDGQLAGLIGVSDPIKPDAQALITTLTRQGLHTAMLTGDTEATANAVATELGINTVHAAILPGEKAAHIAQLQAQFGTIAFVGDGINDAPALSAADIGIALGSGTDVAMQTADIVLISGALSGVSRALKTSHAVMRNIRQNLFWAFAYNVALIPVAAGLLYPMTGLLLSPMFAAAAMALSSVFVVSNALRLRALAP
ncbi:MAG: heavy metal translocating P-type ATPase [Pseudomonadota bacterium]